MSVFTRPAASCAPNPNPSRDVVRVFSWSPYFNEAVHEEAGYLAAQMRCTQMQMQGHGLVKKLSLLDANVVSQYIASAASTVSDWEIAVFMKRRKVNEYRRSQEKDAKCDDFYFVRMTDVDQTVVFPKSPRVGSRELELEQCKSSSRPGWEEAISAEDDLVLKTSWRISGNRFYVAGAIISVGVLEQAGAPIKCVLEVVCRQLNAGQSDILLPNSDADSGIIDLLASLLPAHLLQERLEEVQILPGDTERLTKSSAFSSNNFNAKTIGENSSMSIVGSNYFNSSYNNNNCSSDNSNSGNSSSIGDISVKYRALQWIRSIGL